MNFSLALHKIFHTMSPSGNAMMIKSLLRLFLPNRPGSHHYLHKCGAANHTRLGLQPIQKVLIVQNPGLRRRPHHQKCLSLPTLESRQRTSIIEIMSRMIPACQQELATGAGVRQESLHKSRIAHHHQNQIRPEAKRTI